MPDIFNFLGGGTLVVFLGIVIVVLLVAYLGSRYKVAAANEALIVSGRRERTAAGEQRLKVVRGQGTIVLPLLHRVGRLKLTARQINVSLPDAVTRQGIKVAVQGVATFKIGADDESIQNAAERFLDAKDDEVDSIVKNVLEGSLRSIVGTLTVEELNLDRQKFQQAVQDAAKGDLATSGLQIDSFTIQAIRDESGYMDLIGQQETARRERDARMAKASADQEAAVREAEAEQIKINAARDVALRRAETETQIAAADARAAQAGPLAQAEATQEVVRKQTELAELEAARKQKELLTSTVRPAEAEAEAQVRRAEGDRAARIAAAQADAERVKLAGQAEATVTITKGEAQARVVEVNAEATAKQTTLEGNAEAGIVLSKGEAEAKALALRAEAYRQFNEAAIIQTVLSMLPEIVRAAAEPMANIGSLTVLSSDGASDVVRTTTRTVAEAGAAVKGLTGIDIPALIGDSLAGRGMGGGTSPTSGAGGTPPPGRTTPPQRPTAPGPGPTTSGPASSAMSMPPAPTFSQAVPPPLTVDPAAEMARASEAIRRASEAGAAPSAPPSSPSPAAPPSPAPPPAAASPGAAPTPTAAEALAASRAAMESAADTVVSEGLRLAGAFLRGVTDVERYRAFTLDQLVAQAPGRLRSPLARLRGNVPDRVGAMTVGDILDRTRGA